MLRAIGGIFGMIRRVLLLSVFVAEEHDYELGNSVGLAGVFLGLYLLTRWESLAAFGAILALWGMVNVALCSLLQVTRDPNCY